MATATATAATAAVATATAAATTAAATVATATAAATTAAAAVATTAAATAAITTTATAATTAATKVLARLGFVHAQRTSVHFCAIHGVHGSCRVFFRCHLDKRKAAAAARIALEHDFHIRDFTAVTTKGVPQSVFRCLEGEVAYIQSLTHRVL